MQHAFDAIVIGGGVVGLACAAALSRRRKVLLLERHAKNAMENSARNSGVVHAGIHHDADWLRTQLCLRGRELLERRCRLEDIPYARTGKLIVASTSNEAALLTLATRADDRGIAARLIERDEIAELEPLISADRALLVEPTGILRTAALVRSLEDECDARSVVSLRGAEVVAIESSVAELRVDIEGGSFFAPHVVIAAGLSSDRLAALVGLDPDALGIRQHYVRGTWMALEPRHRKAVSRMVYPLPETDGLGIHLTPDLDGFLMAGPDAEWADAPSFELGVGTEKEVQFADALGSYLRLSVPPHELHRLMVGVRPRISPRDEPARDFVIADHRAHAVPGLIVLAGIESPGLTACLAIAEDVDARTR